ncbi:hypothetical protein P691DRAFT_384051 [Macrolepiota fuliginosa MF-IS2]|uniref:Uncharacterized protein n=1 Tax=Macrolepiota fuliginosa MF-IS2 TaxID=1400762 RepID=A0A9P5X2T4_9AGAR|nr:hypothetical protein P691DRAFT_384051 [Macrolepiota fuliginosa MF-IS2]
MTSSTEVPAAPPPPEHILPLWNPSTHPPSNLNSPEDNTRSITPPSHVPSDLQAAGMASIPQYNPSNSSRNSRFSPMLRLGRLESISQFRLSPKNSDGVSLDQYPRTSADKAPTARSPPGSVQNSSKGLETGQNPDSSQGLAGLLDGCLRRITSSYIPALSLSDSSFVFFAIRSIFCRY